jgi:2-C-methyl-D-erythritol 2,4-cyclodiphosphate synthase/2-C-methyl-D-erythritol 4-phosphate cytidylyltransferase
MSRRRHWLIVPAAGVGARMGADRPKQYLPLGGCTVLEQTLSRLLQNDFFESLLVVVSPHDSWWSTLDRAAHPRIEVVAGGRERSDSVLNALQALDGRAAEEDWVWVHDAARPCVSSAEIDALRAALEQANCPGVVLAVPINDSVKRSDGQGRRASNVDRTNLWRALTPQVFPFRLLSEALCSCTEQGVRVTDEAAAVERLGVYADLVKGSADNLKITVADDLQRAERMMKKEAGLPRIGSGFDVHAFGSGDRIVLGGVSIPHSHGLIAHSDGDVLLHALADALLGALALGDIGQHFPDTDEKWRGADSRVLLRGVYILIRHRGYRLANADMTIIAQVPRMAPHIPVMQSNIADDLEVTADMIGIKATTTEKLGFTGRKEGIACQASVLLVPDDAV